MFVAGIFETVWATLMKYSHGFTKLGFSIATIVTMAISILLLARATKSLPLSIAYPVWTGIGAVGSILVGVVLFKDALSPLTWGFVALLIIGIVGIKMTTGS
ncbi:small multidrug resistance protein [Secundilactobacillus malefermentans DSM 5705 = KCTC 3548]|nr:small multidrug resistance protein [Secundilactobacillus malefermentans DSM 5705 = KCTC 3548]